MNYGLSAATQEKIRTVFRQFPEVEQAVLYGSRAMGNYRYNSDIDLTLKGKSIDFSLFCRIEQALDDLLLPYKIDLSRWHTLDNPELLAHIQRAGVLFYDTNYYLCHSENKDKTPPSMDYTPADIEAKWREYWNENKVYRTEIKPDKPKFYILDMFPYPSGAGLHVGHPLGYIASDIVARYKRLKGFNVLHPMGFDSFGLPAEQYAIETGQHPAITTAENIATYKSQLAKIGFSYDWEREVQTSDPSYYKWTQWIFQQLFQSWYNNKTDKAEPIETLVAAFEQSGNTEVDAACDEDTPAFSAEDWANFSESEREQMLLHYRLTYLADSVVNWCPALGTVLANDEVKDGFSERGGYPVERKKMRQWSMRITAYAERLLQGLETVAWSDALKEMQRNWIGKSHGAELDFGVIKTSPLAPLQGGTENASPLAPLPPERGTPPDYQSNDGDAATPKSKGYQGSAYEKGALADRSERFGYQTASSELWARLKELARQNRKEPTEAEDIFWQAVRNKKLGVKIRRQHAIRDFIADFVCLSKQLVIEIDGEVHNDEEQAEYDKLRTELLQDEGFDVIRFTNDEVSNDLQSVLSTLQSVLDQKEAKSSTESTQPEHRGTPPYGGGAGGGVLTCFTTRPDTVFGVTFVVMAPEHELALELTTDAQRAEVEAYIEKAKNRSERERQADVKQVSGVFTGTYVKNPISGEAIPLWIADYVLAGYGTGVVMAVPSSDDRDFRFAKHFDLPVRPVIEGTEGLDDPTEIKHGKMINSGFLNSMETDEAIQAVIQKAEADGTGKGKINYRLRDAVFSRQRYWGEPVPVYFETPLSGGSEPSSESPSLSPSPTGREIPRLVPESELPLLLPEIDEYKPTEEGEPPLGRAEDWKYEGKYPYELTTMPGWAGSSWYFLRYMDADNDERFVSEEAVNYWGQVDFYIGGTEHAVGHLLYSRFWTKFLYDLGYVPFEEPFKKLVNQGMIQGRSSLAYRLKNENKYVSADRKDEFETTEIHVLISLVKNDVLDVEGFKKWKPDASDAEFILSEDGKFYCDDRVEKMSKSKYNVINPDDFVAEYSADTLRLYEMFLGPIEHAKPWDTSGTDGVHKFLRKLWRLFFDKKGVFSVSDEAPTKAELKTLHQVIKKVEEDIERGSYNTCVSAFMVCVNELSSQKCNKRQVLEPLLVVLASFAPHISEELWHRLDESRTAAGKTIFDEAFPQWNAEYLKEDSIEYPVSVNGKVRAKISFSAEATKDEVEATVLADERIQKWTEGKAPKKFIFVPKRIVNVVV